MWWCVRRNNDGDGDDDGQCSGNNDKDDNVDDDNVLSDETHDDHDNVDRSHDDDTSIVEDDDGNDQCWYDNVDDSDINDLKIDEFKLGIEDMKNVI